MPIVEKHAPGDFCWMELATTTDHAAANRFYSELFPWSFTEFLFVPPMAIEDIARIAVLADPQGALFAIFEASHQK